MRRRELAAAGGPRRGPKCVLCLALTIALLGFWAPPSFAQAPAAAAENTGEQAPSPLACVMGSGFWKAVPVSDGGGVRLNGAYCSYDSDCPDARRSSGTCSEPFGTPCESGADCAGLGCYTLTPAGASRPGYCSGSCATTTDCPLGSYFVCRSGECRMP